MTRIIYFGSSDFSLPGLKACLEAPGYEVAGVITTPPQKQGRGLDLTPTVVAQFCAERNIPCFDFQKLDDQAHAQIEKLTPDIFVVASYGKIIPESFLKLVKMRFNIHPSLLPKYRGASPLNGPILKGDAKTGLSIADVTKSLDAGDIYYQEELTLSAETTSEEIEIVLAQKSHDVMLQLLEKSRALNITGCPKNHAESSYAPKLKKEDGRLSFNEPAIRWDRVVRGLKPWPGAFIETQGERISLCAIRPHEQHLSDAPGAILEITDQGPVIQTIQGAVEWLRVKPAGKKEMSGADYARGKRWSAGTVLK